jgi:hypothetical protein
MCQLAPAIEPALASSTQVDKPHTHLADRVEAQRD